MLTTFSFASISDFFLANPTLRAAQGGLTVLGTLLLFLLFFTLRDILLRTRSFWYQFLCVVMVALLPGVGFLLYLLIRPARSIKQRELEAMILTLVASDAPAQIEVGEMTLDAIATTADTDSSAPTHE